MTNLESNHAAKAADALVKGAASGAGEANRWSEISVDSMKDLEQLNKGSDSAVKSGSEAGKSAATTGSDAAHSGGVAVRAGAEAAQSLGDKIGGKAASDIAEMKENKIDRTNRISDSINKLFPDKVTDEQRRQAKERLDKELSDLIPEKDRASLKNLHSAIIDGDLGKLQATLKELSGNPEHLKKVVDALGKQLGKGTDVRMDSAGNVLLYERGGNTALSVNPKTGETTLRAMETQMDGSVVLKPGEIINRTTGDVLKDIGDEVTRDLTYNRIFIKPSEPWGKPVEPWGKPLDPWGKPGKDWDKPTEPLRLPDHLERNLENSRKPLGNEAFRDIYPTVPQDINKPKSK